MRRSLCLLLVLLTSSLNADEVPTQAIGILKERCWSCHGSQKQESGLRLDSREAVLAGGDAFAPSAVSGKSGESPLIRFIADDNAELRMPPKGDRLPAEEVALLKKWVDAGLPWPRGVEAQATSASRHWSFQPIVRPSVPPIEAGVTPIDAFVSQRLTTAGLSLSPEADRRTLIRRLSFDLLGLPPTPEEVDEFVHDDSPDAYERLVDRSLASPHFGERWARHWLDVVRFAESHGFEMNQARPNAWRYRDYVVRAFNSDLPYDQFIREQLAGDLTGADEATGFLVGGPWDQVKSPDPVLTAQQRADELHDVVSTTGSAFLGLTVGCARCHTHKFDPIPQTDYYALKACFEGVQHGERAVRGTDFAVRQQRELALRKRLEEIARDLASYEPVARPGRRVVIPVNDKDRTSALVPPSGPAKLAEGTSPGSADDAGDSRRLPTLSSGYLYWNTTAQDVFAWTPKVDGRFRVWVSWGCGWDTHAADARYVLDRDGDLTTRNDQSELARVDHRCFASEQQEQDQRPRPGKPLWSGFRSLGSLQLDPASKLILRAGDTTAYVTADLMILEEVTEPDAPATHPHLRVPVTRGRNVDRFAPVETKFVRFTILATSQGQPCLDELEIFTAGPEARNVALASTGAKAAASSTLPGHAIHQLKHVHDGRYGNDWSWISDEIGAGWVQIELPQLTMIDRVEWSRDRELVPRYNDRLATSYRIDVSTDGKAWLTVATSADRLPWQQPAWNVPGGVIYDSLVDDTSVSRLIRDRDATQAALTEVLARPMAYAGRFTQPGPTMRLHRGDATQEREPVPPGSLSQLGNAFVLAGNVPESERRAKLAEWITSPANPLTARVIVNRIWQHHFGEGLVRTPSDLGVNGARPSHPELLDWLACELVRPSDGAVPDWSLKHVHRLICLSAVYRQSSQSHPRGIQVDAGNAWLWRFTPQRLEAEPLRDAILSVTGKLDLQMGGPGFDLFEPNGNYVKVYVPKSQFGPAEFRRMVYQSKPRMQLEDTFGAFDCPDAGQIAPRRNQSTTPLQALNLLNSPFLLGQSQLFAERVNRDAGDNVSRQVHRAFELAFQRRPTTDEQTDAEALVNEHGLPLLCRALLNASEFLMVF